MSLPIAGEVHGLAALQGQCGNPVYLIPIAYSAIVLTPWGLLRISEQVCSSDMVVNANCSPAQAAEILFGLVRAGTVKAISLLMIDALHFKPFMQVIPRTGFVGVQNGAFGNAGTDE